MRRNPGLAIDGHLLSLHGSKCLTGCRIGGGGRAMRKVFFVVVLLVFSVYGRVALGETGSQYVGELQNGRMHGQGTYTYVSGAQYIGDWKDDKRHGQGTVTTPDGGQYVGAWRDGKMHGQGTMTAPDGGQYVGDWKDNKRHGQGTYTLAAGWKQKGYFMDGDYVPDICEGMGFSKDTEMFGQCVLQLVKTIHEEDL